MKATVKADMVSGTVKADKVDGKATLECLIETGYGCGLASPLIVEELAWVNPQDPLRDQG